jgi:hypothetical protein
LVPSERPWIQIEREACGVAKLAFSPDGQTLGAVIGSRGPPTRGPLLLCSIPDGRVRRTVGAAVFGHGAVAFTPDGALVLTAMTNSSAAIVRVDSGEVVHALPSQGHPINAAAISQNGEVAAVADYKRVHLYHAGGGWRPLRVIDAADGVIDEVHLSPNGALLITKRRTFRFWSTADGREVEVPGPIAGSLRFTADGMLMAATPGELVIWRVVDWSRVRTVRLEGLGAGIALLSEAWLAGWNRQQVFLRRVDRDEVQCLEVHAVGALAMSPTDDRLAMGGADRIFLFEVEREAGRRVAPVVTRPSFATRTAPNARARKALALPRDAETFEAHVRTLAWFRCIGEPSVFDVGCQRLRDWDAWPGPEDPGVGALHAQEAEWFDAVAIAARTLGRGEILAAADRVEAAVVEAARQRVPFDEEEDAWHGPTLCVREVAYCAKIVTAFTLIGWPVPDDLAERWAWYEAGHWPCGYADASGEERVLLVL